jgi:hypothetical protein
MKKSTYRKSIYRKITINSDFSVRVYHVKKNGHSFYIVTLIYPRGEIPLGIDETPNGAISRAKLHLFARNTPQLYDALTFLYHLV